MNDISTINKDGLPSTISLIKTTAASLVGAVLILLTVILPAEYGIDPTGAGKALGLTVLSQVQAPEIESTTVESDTENVMTDGSNPLWKTQTVPRSDTKTLTLLPRQGAEIKSPMNVGDNFVFSWKVEGGLVYFDMHGEPPNAGKDEFTSYWIGKNQQQASGNFSAPFKGTHGWYWQNTGTTPVTITLSTNGFYGDLYMP
ncbi:MULTISPECIES: hypothetical protein [unclassified Neptuniibacter]|uniref:hypothetical protein n=1 Tax=unclassified Neptuniibacter TaxID=2630693 RepID=UPI0025D53A04|nr:MULTISPECIES: hypothetical protein [unclassified Neptuniibacter]|tara:strand:+ start:7096 stop:7695 length:600 start_codon:yes stop_codon:yes gene_type:complete